MKTRIQISIFFCDLSPCRSGYRIRSDKKALSYSALRDLFRNTLKPHVCDINKYGLHSLRSGVFAGKGLTSWLSFVVSSVSLSLSHWYPGSGVVLDCIDS